MRKESDHLPPFIIDIHASFICFNNLVYPEKTVLTPLTESLKRLIIGLSHSDRATNTSDSTGTFLTKQKIALVMMTLALSHTYSNVLLGRSPGTCVSHT